MKTVSKRFTRSSLKSFIKKNKDSLFIKKESSFDGMTDGIEFVSNPEYIKVDSSRINFENNYSFGINGLWLVGSSRDSFELNEKGEIFIYNCCGSCTLISKK